MENQYRDECVTEGKTKTAEVSVIDKQFSDNSLAIKQLASTVKNLQEKLSPVMREEFNDEKEEVKTVPSLCLVADKIRISTDQIQSMLDVCTRILNRLEI